MEAWRIFFIVLLVILALPFVALLLSPIFSKEMREEFKRQCEIDAKEVEEKRRERKARREAEKYRYDKRFEKFYQTGKRQYLYDDNFKE